VVLAGVKSKILDGVTTRIASTTVASEVMARHLPSGTLTFLLTACLVAARLRDWEAHAHLDGADDVRGAM
jgi:hypothetical protein